MDRDRLVGDVVKFVTCIYREVNEESSPGYRLSKKVEVKDHNVTRVSTLSLYKQLS